MPRPGLCSTRLCHLLSRQGACFPMCTSGTGHINTQVGTPLVSPPCDTMPPASGFRPTHRWIMRGCFWAAGNVFPLPNCEVQERLLSSGFTVEREIVSDKGRKKKNLGNPFCLLSSQNISFRGELSPFYSWSDRRLRTNACLVFA